MAISRFQQGSGSFDLSVFFQWLNAHKSGTFLENMTLTNSTTSHTNDTITITDTDSTVKIMANQGNHVPVLDFTAGSFNMEYGTQAASGATAYLVGALLCSKGLIIQYNGSYLTYNNINNYGIAVTVDNNEKLAFIANHSLIPAPDETITSWSTGATGSTTSAQRTCRPNFQASSTSLAPITAQGNDDNLYLPYAYAAISTQLNQEGMYAVVIDGKQYISNGVWYIKDGD